MRTPAFAFTPGGRWGTIARMATSKDLDILSVSQLTRRIKSLLENEVGRVWVAGEISNFKESSAGHLYFTLKDEQSQVDVVMFRGRAGKLQFDPADGLEVIVHGQVSVYERRGNYQIICEQMHPKGLGALQLAFEQLRKKLAAEGLFDEEHKKPLPMLPRRIGVVTSATGAAIRDILNVIHRRFANVHVILYPARVQGEEAAPEIVEGIRGLDRYGVDVMIVGRGGGSLEDLWPFNEEAVVRAIYEAKTPVISAVGHEIDYTLSDFAADLRAPTPSAAAELVVQEQQALTDRVRRAEQRLGAALERRLESARNRLAMANNSYAFRRPDEIVRQRRQRTDEARMRLEQALDEIVRDRKSRAASAARSLNLLSPWNQLRRSREGLSALVARLRGAGPAVIKEKRSRLRPVAAHLDALSPLKILGRGYALARRLDDKTLVRDAATLAKGDRLTLLFGKGGADVSVDEIKEGDYER